MRIVFAGSPRFAVPTLERLAAEPTYDVCGVITQPDRPSGRDQHLHPSPVKEAALQLGLTVHQPEKIKSDSARALFESLRPDAMIVVGYGQILPPWLLNLPHLGCINLHGSLLPAYRGAAPIQWAVVNGEVKTGLTTMLMDPGMDTGPILLQLETPISPEETATELSERMSLSGPELMIATLKGLQSGTLKAQPQDNSRATRAPLLRKEDGRIDWNLTTPEIFNRVRGFLPWPGAFTHFRGQKLQIWRAEPGPELFQNAASRPGELLIAGNELRVACDADASLQLMEVQLEGKRRMPIADFLRGARPTSGEQFR